MSDPRPTVPDRPEVAALGPRPVRPIDPAHLDDPAHLGAHLGADLGGVPPIAGPPVAGPRLITPEQIEAAALGPQSVTVDGDTGTARPAADTIALLNYAAACRAAAARRGPPVRFYKTIPPGTVGPSACGGY